MFYKTSLYIYYNLHSKKNSYNELRMQLHKNTNNIHIYNMLYVEMSESYFPR
jgi:hypothetical protein